ncbi:hypothetical protein Tco_0383455 [Tanacetum coccineum]
MNEERIAIKPLAELPQTLPSVHLTCNSRDENSFTYDSKPNFADDSPNVFNLPLQHQYVPYSYPSTFDALNDHYEILSNSNNDGTSSDDDSYENIEYVEASPLNLEFDSLEEVNEDQEEKEFDLEDIFQIQDVILREKLLNISHLLADHERRDEKLASTTHQAIVSLPDMIRFFFEFESFHFDPYDDPLFPRPPPEPPDVEICLNIKTDAPVVNNFDELNEDECFDPGEDEIDVKDDDFFHICPHMDFFSMFSRFSPTPRFSSFTSPPPKM